MYQRFWGPNATAVTDWLRAERPDLNVGAMTVAEIADVLNDMLGMDVPGSSGIEEGFGLFLERIKALS